MTPKARREERCAIRFIWAIFIALACLFSLCCYKAFARDLGQWENTDPAIREWYQNLMQPDAPTASCCSESDGYFADDIHVRNGRVFARITDDRPDGPRHRPHREIGEEFEIPPNKMNKDPNPTGHNVIFLSTSGYVYCFVSGAGI